MRTGVIGLGAMGAPMALNLHKGGELTAVWNRTSTKAHELAAKHGFTVVDSVEELASCCELIILSAPRDADVLALVDKMLPALLSGSVVVDTSTVSMETAATAARRLMLAEVKFLDAPVSGGVEGAKKGTLAMMVGGDETVLHRVQQILGLIAARIVYIGSTGAGQAAKAVNQIMAAGINQAVTEALAFGQAMGLSMGPVIDAVGSGAAGNWFLSHRGADMLNQSFTPGFKINLHHKDLLLCKAMAEKFGVQLPLVEMTLIHYQRLMEAGYGEEDISALFRQKKALLEKTKLMST